jgi:uncharacterized coiled-coil protein SlyX
MPLARDSPESWRAEYRPGTNAAERNRTMPHPAPRDRGIEDRVRALEESLGFAERTIEQLNEEIASLGGRVTETLQRLARVEARLAERDADGEEGSDEPTGGAEA